MPIRFSCPGCNKSLKVAEHLAGRRFKCPECGGVVVAPAAPPVTVTPTTAPVIPPPPPVASKAQIPPPPPMPIPSRRAPWKRWPILAGAGLVLLVAVGLAFVFLGGGPAQSDSTTTPEQPADPEATNKPDAREGDADSPPPPIEPTTGNGEPCPVKLQSARIKRESFTVPVFNGNITSQRLDVTLVLHNSGTRTVRLGNSMFLDDIAVGGDFALAWMLVTSEERKRPDYQLTRLRYAVADLYEADKSGFGSLLMIAGGSIAFTTSQFTDPRDGPGFGSIAPGKTFTLQARFPTYRTVIQRASVMVCSPPIYFEGDKNSPSWRYLARFQPQGQTGMETFTWKQTELAPLTPSHLARLIAEPGRNVSEKQMALNWLADSRSPSGVAIFRKVAEEQTKGSLKAAALYGLGAAGDAASRDKLAQLALDEKSEARDRAASVAALGLLGDIRARKTLLTALEDRDNQMRATACWGLPRLTGYTDAAPLLGRLRDSDDNVVQSAVRALGILQQPDTLDRLIDRWRGYKARNEIGPMLLSWKSRPVVVAALTRNLANHGKAEVRSQCATLLAEMKASDAFDALEAALADRKPEVRQEALRGLGQLGNKRAFPLLQKAASDKEPGVRSRALEALKELKHPDSLATIRSALDDKDDNVCRAAVEALSALPGQNDPAPFLKAMRHTGYSTKNAAVMALARLDNPKAIEALVEALGDFNFNYQAAQGLRQAKDRKAVSAALVRGLTEGGVIEQKRQCARLIGELKVTLALNALTAATSDPDMELRNQTVMALGKLADPRATPTLLKMLNEKDSYTRRQALEALANMPDLKDATPFLTALNAKDDFSGMGSVAARVLGKLGDDRAIVPLVNALGNYSSRQDASQALLAWKDRARVTSEVEKAARDASRPEVRRECLRLLPELADKKATPTLLAALDDKQSDVKQIALQGLARVADRNAVTAVRAMLSDKDDLVCADAVRALVAMGHRDVDDFLRVLKNKAYSSSLAAAKALSPLQAEQAIRPLIDALPMGPEEVRQALLAFKNQRPVVAELNKVLRGPAPPEVRRQAFILAGNLKAQGCFDAVVAGLEDKDTGVVSVALEAARNMADRRARPHVEMVLRHEASYIRSDALRTLEKLGDSAAAPAVRAALSDKDDSVRQAAAEALFALDRDNAREPLLELLRGTGYSSRDAAARLLGRLGDSKTIPALIDALDGTNPDSVRYALRSFHKEQDAVFAVALKGLASHPKANVRQHLATLLGDLDDPAAVPALREASSASEKNVADAARKALTVFVDP